MPKRSGPKDQIPTWTPNQVVASNLVRLRQRRGLTQVAAARELSRYSAKPWTEPMVAHAERSVTGNRIREFTADDLITMARAFDVPVLYFLTPPPTAFIGVPDHPDYGIPPSAMLEAVLGRLDNISHWETLLDEWNLAPDEEVPFPLSGERRKELHALAQEVALVRAHHVVRRYFKGDLAQLEDTLVALSRLVRTVNEHELLADLDEEEQVKQIEDLRAATAKGERLAMAHQAVDEEMLETYRDVDPSARETVTPQDTSSEKAGQ